MRLFLIAAFCVICTPALAETYLDPGQTTTITPDGLGGWRVDTPPRILYVPPPRPPIESNRFAPAQPFQTWGR